jgi:hypothetical protein
MRPEIFRPCGNALDQLVAQTLVIPLPVRALIVRMAMDSRFSGYPRIQGALANLDRQVSRGSIATILPATWSGTRARARAKTTWTEFLHAVPVLTAQGPPMGRARSHSARQYGGSAVPTGS